MNLIHNKTWQATITAIEDNRAVLLFPDGQILRWPTSSLPANIAVGQEINLHSGPIHANSPDTHELAHAIINKIFSAGSEKSP